MLKRTKIRRSVAEAFDALSDQAKAFMHDPRGQAEMPLSAWKAFLAPIAEVDRIRDEAARAVSLAARHESADRVDEHHVRKLPDGVNDQLRGFIVPALGVLELESGGDAPLSLTLDLRGLTPDKSLGTQRVPSPNPRVRKLDVTTSIDPWCSGSLRLGDKGRLAFRCVDRVRFSEITKQSASGKIKHKSKYKTQTLREVTLTLPADQYTWVAQAPPLAASVAARTTGTTERRVIRLRHTTAANTRGSEPDLSGFLQLVAQAYRFVAPVGAGA